MALNTLPALLTCDITNNPIDKFLIKLSTFKNIEGRGNKFKINFLGKSLSVINESYNANPNSMEAAILSFDQLKNNPSSRKVLVIGDMMELGKFSEKYHKKIADIINNSNIDVVYAVGNEIKYLWDEIAFEKKGIFFNDIDKIISNLQNIFENKDNIMFKASSKINLGRIIDELNIAKTIRKIA